MDFLAGSEKERIDLRFSNAAVLQAAKAQLADNGGIAEVLRATNRTTTYRYRTDKTLNILTIFFEKSAEC